MLLSDQETTALKQYLSEELEPITDADPNVLADYVIALLKHDKPNQDLRQLCTGELGEFLKEQTEPFTNRLFQALHTRSFLSGNAVLDESQQFASTKEMSDRRLQTRSSTKNREDSEGSDDEDDDRNFKHRRRGSEPREDQKDGQSTPNISFDDRSRRGPSSGASSQVGHRQQAVSPGDQPYKRRYPEGDEDTRSNKHFRSGPVGPPVVNTFGANNGMSNFNGRWQDRNVPPSGPAGWINGSGGVRNVGPIRPSGFTDNRQGDRLRGRVGDRMNAGSRKPRCRDYDEKGYCMRGDLCPYDHGLDRIVVDDMAVNRPFDVIPPVVGGPIGGPIGGQPGVIPNGRPPFFLGNMRPQFNNFVPPKPSSVAVTDSYDPEQSVLLTTTDTSRQSTSANGQQEASVDIPSTTDLTARSGSEARQNRSGGPIRARGGRSRVRGGYQPYSSRPGQTTKHNSSLVVENIPDEFCALDKVNDFFKKFGTITNINIERTSQKAIVTFSTNAEAYAAYNSPEAIFDNRFVKVYWQKIEKEDDKATTVSAPNQAVSFPEDLAAMTTDTIKESEEKMKKQQTILQAKLDLQKRQHDLLQRQIDARKLLLEKAAKKQLSGKERDELEERLNSVATEIKATASVGAPVSVTSFKKTPVVNSRNVLEEKERERLDRELDALSQMTAATTPEPTSSSETLKAKVESLKAEAETWGIDSTAMTQTSYRGRGGYTWGRGRGSWARGRGGTLPRSFKLDNRTTKLIAKELSDDAKTELRSHLEKFGEIEALQFNDSDSSAIIQFKTRREAEQAMLQGSKNFNNGSLQLSWFTDLSTPTLSATETTKSVISDTESIPAANVGPGDLEEEDEEDDGEERFFKR